jgi:hypothetical protein
MDLPPETDIMAFDAEFLAAGGGKMEGKPKVILTFRPFPEETFAAINLGVSKRQAERLIDDLVYVLGNYPSLHETGAADATAPDPEPGA